MQLAQPSSLCGRRFMVTTLRCLQTHCFQVRPFLLSRCTVYGERCYT